MPLKDSGESYHGVVRNGRLGLYLGAHAAHRGGELLDEPRGDLGGEKIDVALGIELDDIGADGRYRQALQDARHLARGEPSEKTLSP